SWADVISDLERCVKDSHGTVDGVYRAPPTNHSVLSTAPQAAQKPNTHQSCLPSSPPCTIFLGNLPCDVTEDSIRVTGGKSNESLIMPWTKTGIIVLWIRGPILLQTALRSTQLEEVMVTWETSVEIGTIQSRIRMGFRQVSGWPMLRCGYCSGGQDRYDDQGCDCRLGTGRREFGSGYCRVADYREGGDCYKGSRVEQLLSLEGQSLLTQLLEKKSRRGQGYRRSRRHCSISWTNQNQMVDPTRDTGGSNEAAQEREQLRTGSES
ncbi:hypothetical protein U0070_010834, partial [Myodes glareolus]